MKRSIAIGLVGALLMASLQGCAGQGKGASAVLGATALVVGGAVLLSQASSSGGSSERCEATDGPCGNLGIDDGGVILPVMVGFGGIVALLAASSGGGGRDSARGGRRAPVARTSEEDGLCTQWRELVALAPLAEREARRAQSPARCGLRRVSR
ncbi:MAG: hypothetical protein IT370_29200 [Deltaproteobacteria bacterium]|nr:hypothetical protein [Deltaproteobacteria bacterium]